MSLDRLATSATRELLDVAAPDPERRLADLRRTHRRRTTVRAAALLVVVLLVTAGLLASRPDRHVDPAPGPVQPRNGSLLAPLDAGGGPWRTWSVVEGEQLEHLPTDLADFSGLQFTADGTAVVYQDRNHDLSLLDVRTGEKTVLAPCPDICLPALSPDGTRLAFGQRGGVLLRDVTTGRSHRVPVRGVDGVGLPTWSPDGREIAFATAEGVYVMAADGSDVRRVHEYATPAGGTTSLSWSPDGATLAFLDLAQGKDVANHDVRFTVATIGRDGTGLEHLLYAGHCACLGLPAPSVAWSPDGTLIAVAATQGARSPGINLIRPDGTGLQHVAGGYYGGVAWQPVPG